ncbi:hypothetical protein GW17_00056759 [Ensete ventricosum]|nr:hypothetical protein GW17_00056759 [Ensete ventricosum]
MEVESVVAHLEALGVLKDDEPKEVGEVRLQSSRALTTEQTGRRKSGGGATHGALRTDQDGEVAGELGDRRLLKLTSSERAKLCRYAHRSKWTIPDERTGVGEPRAHKFARSPLHSEVPFGAHEPRKGKTVSLTLIGPFWSSQALKWQNCAEEWLTPLRKRYHEDKQAKKNAERTKIGMVEFKL